MLQLFDEGRLTDGKGKTIECKDAIFVMTSNLASDEIAGHGMQLRREADKIMKERQASLEGKMEMAEQVTISRKFKEEVVQPILKHHFGRDEFLGRINEMVYFLPFSRAELIKLVAKELDFWAKKAKRDMTSTLAGTARYWTFLQMDMMSTTELDPLNTRFWKAVERRVVNQLAAAQEKQLIHTGCKLHISVDNPSGESSLTDRPTDKQTKQPMLRLQIISRGSKETIDLSSVPAPEKMGFSPFS
ncbi:putative caseinolytic peptidase B protein-like [Apostichopus japonicus]|uniref:Putative caseinolytic peptidase B protein-like n=1 Tax=Stichopus japonicus TaxID=307972 RepID=A0A2G8JMD2_STIJA|nr:putative caseinolytic peptidase B protein-like [Apostichopus japonicus]